LLISQIYLAVILRKRRAAPGGGAALLLSPAVIVKAAPILLLSPEVRFTPTGRTRLSISRDHFFHLSINSDYIYVLFVGFTAT
jgi:hypothetical protein